MKSTHLLFLCVIFNSIQTAQQAQKTVTILVADGQTYQLSKELFELLKSVSSTIKNDATFIEDDELVLKELTRDEFVSIIELLQIDPNTLEERVRVQSAEKNKRLYEIARFLDIKLLIEIFQKYQQIKEFNLEKGKINIILKDGVIHKARNEENKITALVEASSVLKSMKAEIGMQYERIDLPAITKNQFDKIYELIDIINDHGKLAVRFADKKIYSGLLSLSLILKAADFLGMEKIIDLIAEEMAQRLAQPEALTEFKNGRRWAEFLALSTPMADLLSERLLVRIQDQLLFFTKATLYVRQFSIGDYDIRRLSFPDFSDEVILFVEGINSSKAMVQRWNVFSQKLIDEFEVGEHVVFSPDGRQCLSATGSRVELFDTSSKKKLWEFNMDYAVERMAWSHNGTRIALATNRQRLSIFDLKDRVRIYEIVAHDNMLKFLGTTHAICDLSWSPDDTKIVAGYVDGTVKLWDASSGKLIQKVTAKVAVEAPSFLVSWSPDSAKLVIGSSKVNPFVMSTFNGQMIGELKGSFGGNIVSWSPTGLYIIVGSNRDGSQIWDAEKFELLNTIDGYVPGIFSSNDSPYYIWSANSAVIFLRSMRNSQEGLLFDVVRNKNIMQLTMKPTIETAQWSKDGKRLALGGESQLGVIDLTARVSLDIDQLMLVLMIETGKQKAFEFSGYFGELYQQLPANVKQELAKNYEIKYASGNQ